MAENTNIPTDSKRQIALIQRMMDMCAAHWEGNQRTTKERLAKKLQDYFTKGGKPAIATVPDKYQRAIEEALQKSNIGYACYPDINGGQSIFMVGAKDIDKVQGILNLVYLNDPTHNKSIKASQVSKLAEKLRVNVISLDLTGDDYKNLDKISADKFYSNNMVGSTELDKDYVIETHAYNYGRRDLSTLLVELSAYKYLESNDKKNFDIRLAQAEYDNQVEEEFAEAVMMKTPMNIAGPNKAAGCSIQYNGNIISVIYNKKGKDNVFNLDPSNYSTKKDLVIALKKYTSEILNMACYTPEELRDPKIVKHNRPTKTYSADYSFINESFNKLISELAIQADEVTLYPKNATAEEKVKIKTEYIKTALDSVRINNESGGTVSMNNLVEQYITTADTKTDATAAQVQLAKENLLENVVKNISVLEKHIKTETPAQVKDYAFDMDKELERTA